MNRYLRILRITTLTLVVSLLLVGYAAAQTSSNVTGIIYDADGAVVIGAVVVVKDSDPIRGTATDLKGEFAIDATSDDILEISSLGYKSVAVKLNSRNYIEVRLEEEVSEMDEVVVVGYGEQKKSNLAGAVVSVGGEVVDGITTPDILNSMSGVTPGVGIYQYSSEPGTYDTDIDVRGMGTPLIIIDGAERSQEEFSRLSNSEIESISVLKDASAAIYGVKASNGVVLVTTKQGLKQRPTVSYSGRFGVQMVTDYVEQVTALQYGEMYNESQINTYIRQRSYFQKEDEIWQKLKFDAEYFEDCLSGEQQTYSYMDLLLNETAKQHQHSASVRGGNESTTYYANLSYFFEDGLYRSGSLFSDKINVRLNVTTKLTESLKLNINVSYINTTRSAPSQSLTNIFNSAIIYPVYEEPYANGNSDYLAASEFSILNPLATSDSDISGGADTDERYLQSNFELQFNPVAAKNLTLKARYSYDYNNRDIETFNKQYNLYEYMPNDDEYAAYTYNGPSNFSHEQRKIIRWTSQFSGDYKKTAGKHAFNAMLLFEAKSSDTYTAESYTELLIDEIPSLSAGLSSSDQVSSSSAVETTMSGVSRLNYTFDNKYIVEGIVRADGSSKFAKGNRWGVFYSALGAWRFSEEKFVKNRLKFLSNGKLRFSYGMMGDDGSAVSQYDTGYTYPSGDIDLGVNSSTVEGGYGFGDVWYSALGINDVANTDLTWYTSETINLGLDLGFFNNKLYMELDIFQRTRDGLLSTRNTSDSEYYGVTQPQENINSDQTSGYEIVVGSRGKIKNKVTYRVSANVSYSRSKWLHYEDTSFSNSYSAYLNTKSGRYKDIVWGYETQGVYRTFEEIADAPIMTSNSNRSVLPGTYKYVDQNDDGVIDSKDVVPIGSGGLNRPLLNYGLNISLGYKNIDMTMLWQGAAKNLVRYTSTSLTQPFSGGYGTPLAQMYDRWHCVNYDDPYNSDSWVAGEFQSIGTFQSIDGYYADACYFEATYLRLKRLELGYTLPKKFTSKLGISKCRFYVSGYNLLTFSACYDFVDPEFNSGRSHSYPVTMNINVGADLTF